MAYIDLDDAVRVAIQACVDVVGHGISHIEAADIALKMEEIPTADVVPKSEVERWRRNLEAVLEEIPETKRELAMEIFEEINDILAVWAKFVPEAWHIHQELAELKKKYIGEQENEQKI